MHIGADVSCCAGADVAFCTAYELAVEFRVVDELDGLDDALCE